MADAAFQNAGGKVGMEIWRIEKLAPVAIEKKEFGTFFSGDSYIVLQTKKRKSALEWHIFFWLGKETSQDEMGVAAYKTVELDDFLGGAPIQHREVQGHESPQFMSLFKEGVQYLEGGVASGFRHVDPSAHEPRLLHLKGKRNVRVQQVAVSYESLNDGDVFILDMGQKIYQWNGTRANKFEKLKGLEIATKIKDSERGGKPELIFLDAKNPNAPEFAGFNEVVGEGPIKSDEEGGSDEEVKATPVVLFRVSDASGSMECTEVARRRLNKDMLDTNDSFIVDTGTALFVWVGKGATKDEKKKGMVFANDFLVSNNRPSWTPVTKVVEGGEPPLFKALFRKWSEPPVAIQFQSNFVEQEKKIDTAALYGQAGREEQTMFDDGTGTLKIWVVDNFAKVDIDEDQYGQFYAGDSFIILYTYIDNTKEKHVIYFWQGRDSSQDEKGTSALLAVELDDSYGGEPVQVRVVQGKEPDHFLCLFKGRMIVHEGGRASGFKNRKDEDSYDTDGISLFHVRGTSALNTRAVQVPEVASSLNSGDCFVLLNPGNMYVWYGRGSTAEEKEVAKNIAGVLQFDRTLIEVQEGSENDDFWSSIGGQGEYPSQKELQEEPRDPRLFQCSNQTGDFVVEEVVDFSQDDMINDDVMILDTYTEVFVWIGTGSNRFEQENAFQAALDYVKNAPDDRSPDTPVFRVVAGNEPPMFTCHFLGWNPAKAGDLGDEYARKVAALMGGAGGGEMKQVTANDIGFEKGTTHPYADIVSKKVPNIDPKAREEYLSEAEFSEVFKMTLDAFKKMPKWRQVDAKKKAKLF